MINWICIFLAIVALWSFSQSHSSAFAQGDSKDKVGRENQCITQFNELTATLGASDWPQLERLANRFLRDCKGVLIPEHYSMAYEYLAIANMNLKNPTAALAACEKCLETFYDNIGCHTNKLEILMGLDRFPEARTEFKIAENLVTRVIEQTERALREASDPSYKELYSTKIKYLRSLEEFLDSIRNKFY